MNKKKDETPFDAAPSSRGLAIAGFVFSILGVSSGLGIILGIFALVKMKKNQDRRGIGFAIAGIIIGAVMFVLISRFILFKYLGSSRSSNEIAAHGIMATLIASQAQFKGACVVDQDGDGVGEYGFFQELSGTSTPRTAANQMPTDVRLGEYINEALGNVTAEGIATRHGYHFKIFLPSGDGTPIGETAPLSFGNTKDADGQEQAFICYAWPVRYGGFGVNTSKKSYVVNQNGNVFMAENVDASGKPIYEGLEKVPKATAVLLKGNQNISDSASSFPVYYKQAVSNDGQIWQRPGY